MRLYNHIDSTDAAVDSLQSDVVELESRLEEIDPTLDDEAQTFLDSCDSNHYNILFVGNSITRHGLADYWWSDQRGMAASSDDADYVHQTVAGLSDHPSGLKQTANNGVNFYAFNYVVWEALSSDRAEAYPQMDKYFGGGESIDCVVIQLGENVQDTATFSEDYADLIEHVKDEAPNAKIVTVGDFWKDDEKDSIKKAVADDESVAYVDLGAIQDSSEYEAGMGTQVEGDDGSEHVINHEGVAKHPGDAGMKRIANAVVQAVIGE